MMNTPFRSTGDILSELNRFQNVLDQVFRPSERSSIRAQMGGSFPVINVGTTPDTIEVMAMALGIDASALQLTIDRGLLIISGERKGSAPVDRMNVTSYASERFAGPFRRVVSLPEDADPTKVDASYRDGILRVTVPKRESSKARRIDVN